MTEPQTRKEKPMNVRAEMRRIVAGALAVMGGTGGKRECRYCGRESFPGQPAHWRKDFAATEDGPESDDHCVVTVIREALRRHHG